MPKFKPDSSPDRRSSQSSTFRLSPETLALIDALAAHFQPSPEMPVTKTSVIERAVREMAERELKGKKK